MTRAARLGFTVTFVPPVLLLLFGQLLGPTLTGRIILIALTAVFSIPLAGLWMKKPRPAMAVLAATALFLTAVVFLRTPPPETDGTPLASVNLRRGVASPLRIMRVVPEGDQVILGTYLLPFVHSLSFRSAARLRGIMRTVYGEIESDSAFLRVQPVTDLAIDDMAQLPFDPGHIWEYTPPHATGEKLPTLIFLHGYLGNVKAYLWAMKQYADRYHCVVVLPSFGAGLWYQKGGTEAIERARTHAIEKLPVDPTRIYLVGLSNGGLGVTRAGLAHPTHYAGLGYISAAMEEELFARPAFVSGWSGRPVLVLYGSKDDFVSPAAHGRHTEFLMRQGPRVTRHVYPGEDHFLLLSQLDGVQSDLARWMGLSRR